MSKHSIDTFRPLHDQIVLKIRERDERSKGGIYIPSTAKDQELAWVADVRAVGPGRILESGRRLEPAVRVGDTVILGKYMGSEIEFEGEKYVIVREEHLLAVVDKQE